MGATIQFRRGAHGSLPAPTFNVGEPLFCTDTKQLFICDTSTTMVEFAQQSNVYNKTDVYTKTEIEGLVNGLKWKKEVECGTTGPITLTGLQTIDTVSVQDGYRVLVKDQGDLTTNGIYIAHSGAWTRSLDANTGTEIKEAAVFVAQGYVNADCGFVCISDGYLTLGADHIVFTQFTGLGQIIAGVGIGKNAATVSIDYTNGTSVITSTLGTSFLLVLDAYTASYKRISKDNFLTNKVLVDAGQTPSYLKDVLTANTGVSMTTATNLLTFKLDYSSLSTGGSVNATSALLAFAAAGSMYADTVNNVVANATIDGGAF